MKSYQDMKHNEVPLSPIDEAFHLEGFKGRDYTKDILNRKNPIAKRYGIEIEMNTEKIETGHDFEKIFKFIHILATTPELQYRIVDSLFEQSLQTESRALLEGRKQGRTEISLDLLKDSFSLLKLKLLQPYKVGKNYLLEATFTSPIKAFNGKLYDVVVELAVSESRKDPFHYFIKKINFCSRV